MRAVRVLLLLLGVVAGKEEKLNINKCCKTYEMLSGDGRSCVDAFWPRNVTLKLNKVYKWGNKWDRYSYPPQDARWVQRWLPPGLPLQSLGNVKLRYLEEIYEPFKVQAVQASAAWNTSQAVAQGYDYWRNRAVFTDWGPVILPMPYTDDIYYGIRRYMMADSCVDAARPPLGPFALIRKPNCLFEQCVSKCCGKGRVMMAQGAEWDCVEDSRGYWLPSNSSFARFLRPETPFIQGTLCSGRRSAVRLGPVNARVAYMLSRRFNQFAFSTRDTCVDFQRHQDKTVTEAIFYCEISRITRGVYWMLRPLSYVSALLLLVAHLSIACNGKLRVKEHGWCLLCHAFCLLLYNLGQITYYMTISDEIDSYGFDPPHMRNTCRKIALPMYFLLMAANSWLTAMCANLALGFRKLQVARPGGSRSRRRFLALSVFAWGLPAFMTGWCTYAFEMTYDYVRRWYSPTLVETRTCFTELSTSYALKEGFAFVFDSNIKSIQTCRCPFLLRSRERPDLGQRHLHWVYLAKSAVSATRELSSPQGRQPHLQRTSTAAGTMDTKHS